MSVTASELKQLRAALAAAEGRAAAAEGIAKLLTGFGRGMSAS